ncbi:fibrocystin-L-like [Mercenaria mercenaria]|uniref:fibrocystin-L-like n=1 Tax=Mercenaria mercenaria TaxID=6596 RepID=UPI00234F8F3D|nr:fibrocystin-L-like [Mercenaria mercenaria]
MGANENGKTIRCLAFYLWILPAFVSLATCNGVRISSIEPTTGGIGGDVKVTIFGSGFSDQFSLNDDPNTGNAVYLISSNGSEHACTVHREGSTPNQIMFDTPSDLTNDENHYVKVVVDGRRVDDSAFCGGNPTHWNCIFHPDISKTPRIYSITPQTGLTGTRVKIQGRMFTDRYSTDIATASNGKTQTLLRVYVGPDFCDLYKDIDNLYGLSLTGENSDNGQIECKITGSTVGFFNISYIVEPPYGRSLANPYLYHVSYNDNMYLYQLYTDVTHISHSMGSVFGGLVLTVYGNHFDDRPPYALPRAFIDDTHCEITDVLPGIYIKCVVAAKPTFLSSNFEGNRGATHEYWTNTSINYDDLYSILSLDSSDSGYHSETLDETRMYFVDVDGTRGPHVGRMRFYFKPPHSGKYKIFLTAYEAAKLYVDSVAKIEIRYWQGSEILTLDEKKKYLFEIVHHTSNIYSYINLKVKFFNTTFTNSMTGKAEQERQRIQIRSTVVYDVQELEFDNVSQQIHVREVQMVAIETAGFFRFGMFGVYTEPLTITMTDNEIQNAILALPVWGADETIHVQGIHTTKTTYNITFDSKRGNFPNMDVVPVEDSDPVSYTVTEHTPGVPDLDTVALMMDGVVSEPFSVAVLKAGNISLEKIIEGVFTSKCPKELEGQGQRYNSFEDYSRDFRDYRVRNTEAFCGRYALKNPYVIYKNDEGSPLLHYGTLCFAYRGFFKNIIRILYSCKPSEESDSVYFYYHEFYHFFKTDSATVSDTWYYTCINVYSIVTSVKPGYMAYRLRNVYVYRLSGAVEAYIDSVYLGMRPTTDDPDVYLRRKRPAHYRKAFIDDIHVSALSKGKFRVTIKPLDCGYDFPLFQLANVDNMEQSFETTGYYSSSTTNSVTNLTSTSDVSTRRSASTAASLSAETSPAFSMTVNDSTTPMPSSTFLSTNATEYRTTQNLFNHTYSTMSTSDLTGSATSTLSTPFVQRWPDILSVTRILDASPPVSGLIDIRFNGKERKGLNVSLTAAEFVKELESIENIGYVEVTKTRDCANFDLITTFLSLAGDLPQMKVNYSQLKGINASGTIVTDTDGGLYYDPLMGDTISTVHSLPQVRLSINDVPTACSGDCSFQWDASVTPEVIAVNPQSGTTALSTSVVISGTGFSGSVSGNIVTIGGVECTVTAARDNSITCDVGNGPLGSYPVLVNVDGKGQSTGNVQFTYTSNITSISPTSGSLGGKIF